MTFKKNVCLIVLSFLFNCSAFSQNNPILNDTSFLKFIRGKDSLVDEILNHYSRYHFQIIYTRVNKNGAPSLKRYAFNVDQQYFNPASLIKFPLAIVALEKMAQLHQTDAINLEDIVELQTCGCDIATNNYIHQKKGHSMLQILREMIIMSDNNAYNFFYDFVGMDALNLRMRSLGFNKMYLKNRFTSSCTSAANRIHGGVNFLYQDGGTKYALPCSTDSGKWDLDTTLPFTAGQFYLKNNKVQSGPRDYRYSNYVSLNQAHELLIQLMKPDLVKSNTPLLLDSTGRKQLIAAMGAFPRELKNATINTNGIPDHYYKFFLHPASMNTKDGGLRIYNKVGIAYGFICDVSFVDDPANDVQYFISAAMLAKKDNVMDNGKYNYNDLGIAVLRKIGAMIYAYERSQNKNNDLK